MAQKRSVQNFDSLDNAQNNLFTNMIRQRRGANSISPRNRRVETYDNSRALNEEWICFFKQQCEELKDSEKELND